ncbi:hypothetical protein [Microbacterium sp. J1-1]|uniref:hypothetical protein n=1 Tax=Microbacterium sp. J1-1 TaxID=2992441 RepID=UPI002113A166|nr:hypothetical protein [Microbacterium sp. J1-1]UUE22517.1 hypothetical protein LRQ07_18155 [Microbacterium sp. J1-1]
MGAPPGGRRQRGADEQERCGADRERRGGAGPASGSRVMVSVAGATGATGSAGQS